MTRLFLLPFFLVSSMVAQTISVVTTQPDLADLARLIGGPLVKVVSLSHGHEDIHDIRVKPSTLVKIRDADVFLQMGFSLEHAWVPPLLTAARNKKVQPGGSGFVNCSAGITPLGVPTDKSRSSGTDIHLEGNPHFNLDPVAMRQVAMNVRDGLIRVLPDKKPELDSRCELFLKDLDAHIEVWREKLAPFRGAAFVEYHDSWVYFAARFGLKIVAKLEPKPGLAPTPAHLAEVIKLTRANKAGVVVARPALADVAEKVAQDAGARFVALPLSSTTSGETSGYLNFMDKVVAAFAAHLRNP